MTTQLTAYRQNPPRLPMPAGVADRFRDMGVDAITWRTLTDVLFPSAKTPESILMLLSYCQARRLDPFKRQAHIVPMYSSERGGYVDTVWPGIAELRTTAVRTGQYAGRSNLEFGPMVTRTFEGVVSKQQVSETVTYPEWAQITVHRLLGDTVCAFEGDPVYWEETYATRGKSDVPNAMWVKRPRGQLIKCAEAAALRCAFPEELGSEYAMEEMEGRALVSNDSQISAEPTVSEERLSLSALMSDPALNSSAEDHAASSGVSDQDETKLDNPAGGESGTAADDGADAVADNDDSSRPILPADWASRSESDKLDIVEKIVKDWMPDYPLQIIDSIRRPLLKIVSESNSDDHRDRAARICDEFVAEQKARRDAAKPRAGALQ